MEWIGAAVMSILYILMYLLPALIIGFVLSHIYTTRQNTKYIIRQNQEMIELLKDIKNQSNIK
ncbi:hypothetical protein KYI11_03105 [Macrococcoides bohemicum]|uniref:Uncharacterized protein n=1 Tax=Macrococcoides bohemicum TaxID=1903056 RepID=A0AAJ4P955_9STAP|nr:hypothetical protein [Macrococcus bohemicus]QYA42932.1 hypothetical protein KYI11_03105 [Macrococcus bohemicus]QYA45286.1 hypothetical protein KYI13_02860 [Macrococcus bohemicus]